MHAMNALDWKTISRKSNILRLQQALHDTQIQKKNQPFLAYGLAIAAHSSKHVLSIFGIFFFVRAGGSSFLLSCYIDVHDNWFERVAEVRGGM